MSIIITTTSALQGLRVIEKERLIAGPFAGKTLELGLSAQSIAALRGKQVLA